MSLVLSAIILFLTTILLLPIIKNYKHLKRISKYIDSLPGEKWYPIIGTSLPMMKLKREQYFTYMRERHIRFGPMVRSWYGKLPVVHIYKPEHAQTIFKSNTLLNKGRVYHVFSSFLGEGLISGGGPKWKEHRKIITPSFHFKVLDSYSETFAKKGLQFAKYLEQFAGKGYFEVTELLSRLGTDIISETAMGVELNLLEEPMGKSAEYSSAIVEYLAIARMRLSNPVFNMDFIFKRSHFFKKSQEYVDFIHSFNNKVIHQRREYLKENSADLHKEDDMGRKQKVCFLDTLLLHQQNNNVTDQEIEEEVNTFMFGGQDTTISTLLMSFLALGNNPEVMKNVHEELDLVFADDPDRLVTPQDVAQLEYLDRVVKEVLRCYCFIPNVARELGEDIEIDGTLIPKGCTIMISLYSLHHDPEHYPDPYKFDPDRFLPENVVNRHPYAFVPFSAGARNCIGQKFAMRNTKAILASVLRKYNVTCKEKPEEVDYYVDVVTRPQNGLHIALELRK